eukprot:1354656-Amorphochlora_amoeboformis.AAC.1
MSKVNIQHHRLQRSEDPFVEGIGDISYHPESKAMLVSGLTDLEASARQNDVPLVRLLFIPITKHLIIDLLLSRSHSENFPLKYDNTDGSYATSAIFMDPDKVLVCDRHGGAAVYDQGFSKP